MAKSNEPLKKIHILAEDVSRKIAAGEVIERPYSLVRELLDNSLDACPHEISVYLEEGGTIAVRVLDDGSGMPPSDLKICFFPHATSKIHTINDLETLTTLGFRGEALSSMAACARLEIISALQNGSEPAHRLLVQGGKLLSFEPYQGKAGTVVTVSHLFFNIPARKKFLKRASAETSLCKAVFIDKAMPFPQTAFKLFIDDELKLFLEKQSPVQRVAALYDYTEYTSLFFSETIRSEDFSLSLIGALPELNRKDRRHVQIFVNKRRIFEYSLIQAVEYGFRGYLPGGLYPVCFVFLEVNPELVDFNIHPAKKEARIKNLPMIHQALVTLLKGILARHYTFVPPVRPNQEHKAGEVIPDAPAQTMFIPIPEGQEKGIFNAQVIPPAHAREIPAEKDHFLYMGQLWKVFLIFGLGDVLYLVDQHAAHERLLFDTFRKAKENIQPLLFPICFEVSEEEKAVLEKNILKLAKSGFVIERVSKENFEIKALPENLHVLPEAELVNFLKSQEGTLEDLLAELYRRAACKTAVKEGEELDELTAHELFKGVWQLENPRCPHGRPIYYALKKDELFKLVGRII